MTIVIVRHGETDGNAARVLQRPDVPLNDRGMRQAELVAQRLAARRGSLTPPLQRLGARSHYGGSTRRPLRIAVEESPLLQERNFGDLRGTAYAALAEDPFGPTFAPPNGDTGRHFTHASPKLSPLLSAGAAPRMEPWWSSLMVWSVARWSRGTRWCRMAPLFQNALTIPASPSCTRKHRTGWA